MSDFGSTTPIHLDRGEGKGLATGTLGLWGSTVIGLASTAPVYSLVATLGFVVLAVGAQAPIAFIIAFVPMLFIAFAYRELNNEMPDCGLASGSVRTRKKPQSACWPSVVHVFWPLTI